MEAGSGWYRKDASGKMRQEIRWLPSSKHDCTGSHHKGSCWEDSSFVDGFLDLLFIQKYPSLLTWYGPNSNWCCSHLHKCHYWWQPRIQHTCVLWIWFLVSYLSLLYVSHHTLDLLCLKFFLFTECTWLKNCLDPNLSTRPLCGFTLLMYRRHSAFGFSCVSGVSPSSSASSWAHSGLGSMGNHSEWKPLQDARVHLSRMSHHMSSPHVAVNMR